MQPSIEALEESFERTEYGFEFNFGDGYKLTFEPLFWGNWYVALYQDGLAITAKVAVKLAKEPDPYELLRKAT